MAECTYGYPILTAEECVSFFREVTNSAISEEDFKKPDAKRWQIFYGTLFELMTGRQADLTAQSRLHTLADSEYTELHEESLTLMSFTMALQRTMSGAGIEDFTVRDLIEPRPKRLLRIVSGAINFIRFRMYREVVFNKMKDSLERKRESYDYVLKENAELKKTLQAKQTARDSHMMKMTKLQEENDAIALSIQELHKQREVLQRNVSEMKSKLSESNAANDQIKVNILGTKEEGDKLSQRIIQSPERLKAEQERAKNRIMELKVTVQDKHRRLDEVQRQKEQITNQQKGAEIIVRMLRDMSNDSDRLGEMEKESQRLQDTCQELHSTQVEQTARVNSQRQQQASRHDKSAKMDLQYHNKKASMQEQITQLSQLKETLHDPRGSSESKKAELMKEKELIMEETEKKLKEKDANLEQVTNLYSEILQQVDKGNIKVATEFQQVRANFKNCSQES
ncbi:uncharacterized protein LOC143291429 isoform X2 [Babylonia areolata]|uniref:uncharacterized protein LOC143291429 isoform X2 n=1 Tax=Babylonia areolata TaxID=304850 RepID=UPI003FCF13E9